MTYEEATPGVYRPFIAGSADGFALLGLKSWDLCGGALDARLAAYLSR